MKKNLFSAKGIKLISAALVILGLYSDAHAQLNPMGASLFQDQYLSNPAMAGINGGISVNLHYRNQWNSIPGAPVNYGLTGEFGLGDEKSTVGLNMYNDKVGLLSRTRMVGTFAYHLPLNGQYDKLSFGVSIGFMSERVNNTNLIGDESDPSIGSFNNQSAYIDGDFGIAYTNKQWNVQASITNMNSFLNRTKRTIADVGTYFAAVGYRIFEDEESYGFNIEPKVAYRRIRGYNDILDVGAEVTLGSFENKAKGMVVYHSSKSISGGISMIMKSRYELSGFYNMQTSALRSNSGGIFEIGLGVRL